MDFDRDDLEHIGKLDSLSIQSYLCDCELEGDYDAQDSTATIHIKECKCYKQLQKALYEMCHQQMYDGTCKDDCEHILICGVNDDN